MMNPLLSYQKSYQKYEDVLNKIPFKSVDARQQRKHQCDLLAGPRKVKSQWVKI